VQERVGKAHSRSDIGLIRIALVTMRAVGEVQHTLEPGNRVGSGRIKVREVIVAFVVGSLIFPPKAEIQRQVPRHFPVVVQIDVVAPLRCRKGRANCELTAGRRAQQEGRQPVSCQRAGYARVGSLSVGACETKIARRVVRAEDVEGQEQVIDSELD